MFPSSGRIKLNRVALKDVAKPRPVPRRRRASESPNDNVTGDPREQVTEADNLRDNHGPVHGFLTLQTGPESVTHTSGNPQDGGPRKAKRKRYDQSCKDFRDNKNAQPTFTGLAGSEGSLRRAVGASGCGLCGNCKYISPQQRSLGKQGPKSISPEPESVAEFKLKTENAISEASRKIVVWIDQYPRVTLCDVASYCDACSHNCGFVLPDIPETKDVRCFKQDMRAGFRFYPSCLGHDKRKIEEFAPAKNIELIPRVQPEESVSQGLSQHQGKMQGCPDAETLSAEQMVSELSCEGSEVNTDDPESFTCQRVRAYVRKVKFSCARTYMSWPFSNNGCTLMANASITACAADSSPINQSGTLSSQTKTPTDPSSDTTNQVQSSEEKQEENGESILNESSRKGQGCMFSCSPDSTEAEKSLPSKLSCMAMLSTPSQCRSEPHTASVSASTPVNEPETNSPVTTSSPSLLGLSNWETATTLSPMSSPFTHSGFSSLSATPSTLLLSSYPLKKGKGIELADAHSTSASPSSPRFICKPVEKLQTFQISCCSASPCNQESSHSCESSLILPQDEQESDEDVFSDRSPPKLEPYYNTSPFNNKYNVRTEFMLLPMLSPVPSPQRCSQKSSLPQSCCCSEEEEVNKDLSKHEMLPEHHMPQIRNGSRQSCDEDVDHQHGEHCHKQLDGILSELKTPSSLSSVEELNDANKEEGQDETDYEDDGEQDNSSSEQVPLSNKVGTPPTSVVLTEAISFPSSHEDDVGIFNDDGQPCFVTEESFSPSEIADHEVHTAEAPGDTQPSVLDEFTAYEQDILLVDVIQDDPELFKNLPEQSLLKLGPARASEASKTRPAGVVKTLSPRIDGASQEFERKYSPVNVNFHWDSPNITEEREGRPWRPQSNRTSNSCLGTEKQTQNTGQPDANNNHVSRALERSQPIQTVNSSYNIPPLTTKRNGSRITNLAECRWPKSNAYCRQYFSESLSCGFKMCRFQHVPVDGDEKFCVETVMRFTKNPMCLQKAGAVFTGYYQSNPPGVYFSVPVLLTLLWALLKADMVSDVFSVVRISLAHKIVPSYEFLLALYIAVREKGLMSFIPELMQLTFEMSSAGLMLSLDSLDCVKNTLEFQHTVRSASPASGIPTSEPFPEYLNLAHSIVEIELCAKQEDWRRMGEVFRFFFSICQFSQHPNQVERISGRVTIALLSESKDKLFLPFAVFAETVCQSEGEDSLVKNVLGRIGVSLMLRYHKTHQWAKGRRVVEVLFMSKISYSTLKGLFGNEDGASRCCLVTVAAELFLLSGSVQGALNSLRENNWFLSSCSWPCEPADLESRSQVLMRLAEKTSHRDTLEILCNLPGIKEPNDMIEVSRYTPLFNSHLQVCVDRQILSVASDTVDFMLSKHLSVDHRVLQILLHKLGRQNHWLRAREVFRHSLSVGYYQGVSAPVGFMSLMVPSHLGEVEVALTFEMFLTVNATSILQLSDSGTSVLSITLKRTQSCESEYLSAGSRILSAACIPQPKLTVHYTAVNASQEQVFILDISSARRWLRHNHLWASGIWMQ